MAQAQDAVWLPVLPSMKGFGAALVKGAGSEADKAGKGIGQKFGTAIVGGTAAVGAGAAAAGMALYKVGEVFDEVSDTIRAGTGKTGKDLDGLVDIAKKVGSTVPAEFDAIGQTVADVNTRMGLSGATLEKVASQYLEAGRVLGEEVDVAKTSAAFNAFGIEGENVVGAMDHLFQVSQATGVSMNELAANASRSAPAMKTLGFSFEETTAMVGSFDKAGLNSGAIMASMSKGLVTLAKDGEEPQEAFKRTVGEIEGFIKSGDKAGALNLASKVFGTKGATQFIGALESGALNMDDLGKAAGQTEDTILGVGKETMDFAEQWMLFKNRVLVWLEPLGARVFGGMATAMGEVNGAVMAFGAAWKANDGDVTSSGLPGFFERLAFGARKAVEVVKTVWAGFKMPPDVAASFGDRLNPLLAIGAHIREVFDRLSPVFAPLIPQVFALVMAFSPLGLIFKVLQPVLPQIVDLFSTLAATLGGTLTMILPTITGLVGTLVSTLSGVLVQVLPTIVTLVGAVGQVFALLAPVIGKVLTSVAPLISTLVSSLAPIITNLVTSVLPPLVSLFLNVASVITPLVDILLAMLIPAIQFLMPVVQFAFTVIASVIQVAVGIVVAVLTGVIGFIRDVLAPIFTWLYANVIKPAWDGIQMAVQAVVTWFTTTALPVIQAVFATIGAVFSWLYNNIVKPVFGFISSAVNAAWMVMSFIFGALVAVVQKVLGPVFQWLYNSIIKPVFDAVGKAVSDWWNGIVLPVFNAVSGFLRDTLGPAFDWLWKNAIKPAFDGIGSAIKTVWETIIKPVFDTLSTFITKTIPKAFEDGVGFIKTHWQKIQDIAKAPVKFVIEKIINDGLIGGLNGIAGFLGLKPLPKVALPEGFMNGGYTGDGPKRQVKGPVHAGEFVFTKEQTAALGKDRLAQMASAAVRGAAVGPPMGGSLPFIQGPLQSAIARTRRMLLTPVGGYPMGDLATASRAWNGRAGVTVMPSPMRSGIHAAASNQVYVGHGPMPAGAIGYYSGQSISMGRNNPLQRETIIHEVGHALGLHHNTGNHSIMHPMLRGAGAVWPTAYDTANLRRLYGMPGSGARPASDDGSKGGGWNPIADIVDGLLDQFKKAFTNAGFIADLAIGLGKKLIDGAVDFVTGKAGQESASQSAPFLHDQGGVVNPGLSSILNLTRKPEALLNSKQWETAHQAMRLAQNQGGGDVIIQGNVGWDPHRVAQEIEVGKRRAQTMAGMSGVVFA